MSLAKQSVQVCLLLITFSVAVISSTYATYGQMPLTPGHDERNVGISLYKQGNTESAVKALRNAVKVNRSDFEAWYFLGLACSALEDVKCARKAFEETIKLRPDFPEARTGLAYSLLRLRKFKEAVREAERSLSMRSGQEAAHYVIGAVHLNQNSYLSASEQADAALKATPNYPPALLLKSEALFGLYLDEIMSNRPLSNSKESADLIGKKRLAYLKDAAASLEQFIRLRPNDPDIRVWQEQLETIKAHATGSQPDAEVFSGRDVTTKAIVTRKPEPQYTVVARGNGVTGNVVLRAIFAADGTVRNIRVVKGLPDGLTQAAVAAARRIKFIPATKSGRPVSMYVQLEYYFHLY